MNLLEFLQKKVIGKLCKKTNGFPGTGQNKSDRDIPITAEVIHHGSLNKDRLWEVTDHINNTPIEDEMDFELQKRCKEAEERITIISEEFKQDQVIMGVSNDASILIRAIRNLSKEKMSLAMEVSELLQSKIAERASAEEALRLAMMEMQLQIQRLEREKKELQYELEKELDRRSTLAKTPGERMDLRRPCNLLDQALGLEEHGGLKPLAGAVVLIEDCVETSGAFVLHHLIKRSLSPSSLLLNSSALVFIAFSQPFSHYDRVLRKLGCNLSAQREDRRLVFFDMLMFQCPDETGGKAVEAGLASLFQKVQDAVSSLVAEAKNCITVVMDDVSLMEVAANGYSDDVLNFMHYCHTLTSDFGCTLIALNHEDIYYGPEGSMTLLQMEYMADVLVRTEPLATGSAADVHGQLTISRRKIPERQGISRGRMHNFHFRVKENNIEYFYPGTLS
ncbi:hypothetical protein SAY86_026348 [Trapa natans]|uniref:Elongator complex protein 6 n=1 Tax=Trapa natans TaxID=22666 RepID=A0AAN7QEY7_TRANT|nr:hypothetical protein SAY86_026348 [Trapa natans]